MKQTLIILIITCISCAREKSDVTQFVGKWHDTEYTIPSKGFLEINADNTFYYRNIGCQWRTISKGSWKVLNDTIELTSGKIDTCYNSLPFMQCLKFGDNLKVAKTITNCNPENQDTDFARFEKERFYLKNDTLTFVNTKKLKCLDSINILFTKTEKRK